MQAKDLFSLTRAEFGSFLINNKLPEIHKINIMKNLYRNFDFNDWSYPTLPKKTKDLINQNFFIQLPDIKLQHTSNYDHSVKFVLEFTDKNQIEMVLMPEKIV
ncbi:hypothetical protein MEO40_26590 [Dolichospermum sp. ST_sed1]|nr:hypothetical protein [Dolichospermum sp. ST_sed1]